MSQIIVAGKPAMLRAMNHEGRRARPGRAVYLALLARQRAADRAGRACPNHLVHG